MMQAQASLAATPAGLMGLGVTAAVSAVIAATGLVVWRRDRVHLLLLLLGPAMAGLAISALKWEHPLNMAVLCLACLAIAMMGYWLVRWSALGFSSAVGLVAGGVSPLLAMFFLSNVNLWGESTLWRVAILPAGLFSAGILAAVLYAGRVGLRSEEVVGGKRPAKEESDEKRMVLDMLGQGKISAAQAAELMDAIREPAAPADKLPISGGIVTSLIGGIVVVIGWAMPWQTWVDENGMTQYRPGFEYGLTAWLVVLLAVVPAVLACVPSLDNYMRQGMLRLFLGLIGVALAASLLSMSVLRGDPSPAISLCVLGFGVQVAGALKESGLIQKSRSVQ